MVHVLALLLALLSGGAAQAQCIGSLASDGSNPCPDAATVRSNLGFVGTGAGTVTSVGAGEGLTTSLGSFGGSITGTGTLSPVVQINAQTGTTYAVANSDCGKLITYNNASSVAVTLPQAGAASSFLAGCKIWHMNLGAGNVTITPTTSTIDGLTSRVLQRYGGMHTISNGTNYFSGGVAPAVGSDGIIDPDQLPTATDTTKGGVIAGTCITMGGTGNKTASVSTSCRTSAIEFVIDGGGSAITTSTCSFTSGQLCVLEVPFACTITAARMFADQSGSIVVELAKTTYSSYNPGTHPVSGDKITSSTPPTISSTYKSQDTTLTGWTTSVSAGDIIGFSVTSATTVTRVTVSLTCVKT